MVRSPLNPQCSGRLPYQQRPQSFNRLRLGKMIPSYLPVAFVLLPAVLGVQECYICLGGEPNRMTELEYQFPGEKIPVCQRGVAPLTKQCPPGYKGCLTQYRGERIIRSCTELNLTLCQKTTTIEYCYCKGNLCNFENASKIIPPEAQTFDDEDLLEGSGKDQIILVPITTVEISQTSLATSLTAKFSSLLLTFYILNSIYVL